MSRRLLFSFLFCFSSFIFASEDVENAFNQIYEKKSWGTLPTGEGSSGEGSVYQNARPYLSYLQEFIDTHHIHRIVDIGCGDWELLKHLDLSKVEYYGFDVVRSVIERNQSLYSAPNLHFIYADATEVSLPDADLLICKDVLQHLSFFKISQLLEKFSQFKYCLFSNEISQWKTNRDIACGNYRPLNLFAHPFDVAGEVVLIYPARSTTKQVVLLISTK